MKTVRTWAIKIGAIFTALAAAFFVLIGARHRKRIDSTAKKVGGLIDSAKESTDRAEVKKQVAQAELMAAKQKIDQGREELSRLRANHRLDQLKENGHENLANRISAYNDRVRKRT